jgi:hypothetical protein
LIVLQCIYIFRILTLCRRTQTHRFFIYTLKSIFHYAHLLSPLYAKHDPGLIVYSAVLILSLSWFRYGPEDSTLPPVCEPVGARKLPVLPKRTHHHHPFLRGDLMRLLTPSIRRDRGDSRISFRVFCGATGSSTLIRFRPPSSPVVSHIGISSHNVLVHGDLRPGFLLDYRGRGESADDATTHPSLLLPGLGPTTPSPPAPLTTNIRTRRSEDSFSSNLPPFLQSTNFFRRVITLRAMHDHELKSPS